MAGAVRDWIDGGRLQVFSIDGHGPRTLFSDELPPPLRMPAYVRFERVLFDILVPEIARQTGRHACTWAGASYGAFVVANALLARPDRVLAACGLGGVYGLWHRLDGHDDDTVRSHTPLDSLPRLTDPVRLDAIRRTGGIRLYAGSRDEWRDSTERFAVALESKGIPHEVRRWPEADHHERWWRRQLREFLHDRWGEP
jgi:esterase/lipase superfamily enzyme